MPDQSGSDGDGTIGQAIQVAVCSPRFRADLRCLWQGGSAWPMGFPNVAFYSVGNCRRQLISICQFSEIGVQRFRTFLLITAKSSDAGNLTVLIRSANGARRAGRSLARGPSRGSNIGFGDTCEIGFRVLPIDCDLTGIS